MMNWTDRFCRYFLRLISQNALLYTEMISTGAILYGNANRHLRMRIDEQPVALQLGGADPGELARASKIASSYNYAEINFNCGCPSSRVQNGHFGAALMKNASRTADCISAMLDAVELPITIKHRLGVDDLDSYDFLRDFIGAISMTGCKVFILHARKAWLTGISPKENRELPPLNYERVYQVKKDFPHLSIILNGGIANVEEATVHLRNIDGVMMGRAAYHNPYVLAKVDQLIFGSNKTIKTRKQIADEFAQFVEEELSNGVPLNSMIRHILGLFYGMRNGKRFRRHLSENACKPNAQIGVLHEAVCKATTDVY
ncbi:MAG: tRNA dihydrouridine(20/20a) synthase DusA [Cellvibrionales bacterium TMED49]|nr:MAG: tRNA dihydrouridine(20/20a) synthase DusA [Cellvibrionales bacterium TMED49]